MTPKVPKSKDNYIDLGTLKQSVLSVCLSMDNIIARYIIHGLSVCQHKNRQSWGSKHHSKMQVSLQRREGPGKKIASHEINFH